ncbi:hypothetical protein NJB1907E19_03010, partial [Mycobacterium marinum]
TGRRRPGAVGWRTEGAAGMGRSKPVGCPGGPGVADLAGNRCC